MLHRVMKNSGFNAYFSLTQNRTMPDLWRELMDFADRSIADGTTIRPVIAPRPIGMLLGLEASQNPFAGTATYQKLADLPLAERVAEMRKPEVKRQILSEDPLEHSTWVFMSRIPYSNMYVFGDPPNYTPAPDESLEALAQKAGVTPEEFAYDTMIQRDGTELIYTPFSNYARSDMSPIREMLENPNPNTIMGLGDGGAHVGFILDAGFPTWLLTYWVRDQGAYPLEEAVRRLTSDTADAVGLSDRGRIAPGLRADINVIDLENLNAGAPYVAKDLPLGGGRLLQPVTGYEITMLDGVVTYRHGKATGAKPGQLVRAM